MTDAKQTLDEIASEVSGCTKCLLSASRKKAVPGEGPAHAEMMLIGEGPGFYENQEGRPFVGTSGQYLDELLQKAGVARKDVFITNVVKCRPPGNRDPLPEELAACNSYLERQIEAIDPLIIVTLGRYSMAKFLPNVKISAIHGRPAWIGKRLVIPMFHPAAALHQPSLKASLERDFARLPEWIQDARAHQADHMAAVSAPQAGLEPQKPTASQSPMLFQGGLFADLTPEAQPPEVEEVKKQGDEPTQLSLF